MKKLLLTIPLALGLTACNPLDVIQKIRADAIAICGFDPAFSMIEAAIRAAIGAPPGEIADAICKGVSPLQAARLARRGVAGAPSIIINGQRILVQGHFVR